MNKTYTFSTDFLVEEEDAEYTYKQLEKAILEECD